MLLMEDEQFTKFHLITRCGIRSIKTPSSYFSCFFVLMLLFLGKEKWKLISTKEIRQGAVEDLVDLAPFWRDSTIMFPKKNCGNYAVYWKRA